MPLFSPTVGRMEFPFLAAKATIVLLGRRGNPPLDFDLPSSIVRILQDDPVAVKQLALFNHA